MELSEQHEQNYQGISINEESSSGDELHVGAYHDHEADIEIIDSKTFKEWVKTKYQGSALERLEEEVKELKNVAVDWSEMSQLKNEVLSEYKRIDIQSRLEQIESKKIIQICKMVFYATIYQILTQISSRSKKSIDTYGFVFDRLDQDRNSTKRFTFKLKISLRRMWHQFRWKVIRREVSFSINSFQQKCLEYVQRKVYENRENYLRILGSQASVDSHCLSLYERVRKSSFEFTQTIEVKGRQETLTKVCTRFVRTLSIDYDISIHISGGKKKVKKITFTKEDLKVLEVEKVSTNAVHAQSIHPY